MSAVGAGINQVVERPRAVGTLRIGCPVGQGVSDRAVHAGGSRILDQEPLGAGVGGLVDATGSRGQQKLRAPGIAHQGVDRNREGSGVGPFLPVLGIQTRSSADAVELEETSLAAAAAGPVVTEYRT